MIQQLSKAFMPIARLLTTLVSAAALLIVLALVPVNLKTIQGDWLVTSSYPAVERLVTLEMFALYIAILRYMAAAVMFISAGILLWFRSRMGIALLGAAMVSSWVPVFGLGGPVDSVPLPEPWKQVVEFTSFAILFSSILTLILFIFLFPGGRFSSTRAGRGATLMIVLLVAGIVFLFSGAGGEWAWFGLGLLLITALLAGTANLYLRYRRTQDQESRSQIRPVMAALMILVTWFLISIFASEATGSNPYLALLSLHLEIAAFTALPVSLLVSIARHQLWGIDLRPHRLAILGVSGTLLMAAVLSGFTLVRQDGLKQAQNLSQAAALVEKTDLHLIVDTDFGNDDVLALLYLMQHPGVELKAISVVGTGLIHCQPGIRHVHGLLELTGYGDVPVSCGPEEPLGAEHPFPEDWRQGADRLWGLNLPQSERRASPLDAPSLIIETLSASDQPTTVLALGPLTNLAIAFQAQPQVIDRIERLYIMGGAVEVPGNVYNLDLGLENQTAEWNIYADPVAAQIVFESGVPITMVPLDATNYAPVSMPLFQRLQKDHKTRAATFTYNIFYINQGWIQTGFYYLWDTLTAAILTSEELAGFQDYNLQVVTEKGADFGRTMPSTTGTPVRVATRADAAMFEELFLHVINLE